MNKWNSKKLSGIDKTAKSICIEFSENIDQKVIALATVTKNRILAAIFIISPMNCGKNNDVIGKNVSVKNNFIKNVLNI